MMAKMKVRRMHDDHPYQYRYRASWTDATLAHHEAAYGRTVGEAIGNLINRYAKVLEGLGLLTIDTSEVDY